MQHGVAGEPLPQGAEPWQRLEGVPDWDALVLPRRVMEELQQVPAQFSERFWASSSAASGKRGLLLLFSGPSGTGKTLAARTLGGELHLPVLEADVADLAARGRGEAGQVVARLFAAAQRTGAIVVLDRADFALTAGMLGEADVSGFAAVDVQDLLRRAEAYPGIVVVPTEGPVPDATRARFDQVIEFPFPDATARGEIWRRTLPPGLRLPGEVIALLGASLELTGGAIAAICAQAAAEAQAAGEVLRPERLADVVERRYGQVGPNVSIALARLRGWARSQAWGSETRSDAPPAPLSAPSPLSAPPPVSPAPVTPPPATPPPLTPPAPPPSLTPSSAPSAPRPWEAAAAAPAARAEPPAAAPPAAPAPAAPAPAAVPPLGTPPPSARAEPTEPRKVVPAPVEPRRAPEPPRRLIIPVPSPEARRRARRGVVALAVVGALSAVGLGIAVAQRGKSPAPPATPSAPVALDQTATVGPLHFTYPSAWNAQSATPISGLTLQPATMITSATRPTGDMVIGITNTPSTSPLPTSFIASTIQGQPAPETVTLGPNHFIRVLDPRVSTGMQSRSIYVFPTGAGTIIALCDTASKTFVSTCERILATLQVTVPKPRPTGPRPNLAYAHSLSTIMGRLNAARSADSRLLAAARTPATQAAAARLLASAHAQASTAVGALNAGAAAGANAALAASLRQASLAYATLARAAAAGSASVYSKATGGVNAANAAIAADLATLRKFGYTIS